MEEMDPRGGYLAPMESVSYACFTSEFRTNLSTKYNVKYIFIKYVM